MFLVEVWLDHSRSLENAVRRALVADITHHLLGVVLIDLALPLLEDVINDLGGCVGLEQLGLVVGLREHVVEAVEGGDQLALARVADLEGRRDGREVVAEGHLAQARLVNDGGEDGLDALRRLQLMPVLSSLVGSC